MKLAIFACLCTAPRRARSRSSATKPVLLSPAHNLLLESVCAEPDRAAAMHGNACLPLLC